MVLNSPRLHALSLSLPKRGGNGPSARPDLSHGLNGKAQARVPRFARVNRLAGGSPGSSRCAAGALSACLGQAELRRHRREHPLIDDVGVALALAHGLDDVPRDRLLNDALPAELVEPPDQLV